MKPFSNGSEFMYWYDNNCSRCTRAMHMAEMPDFDVTQKMVNLGRECRLKFALDLAVGGGTGEIPDDVAAVIGTGEHGLKESCMMFSDNEDDRWRPPNNRKPPPEDPMQGMLFSVLDEEEVKIEVQELQNA